MKCRFSMLIQWSDEDQVFVVSLPEFGPYCKTHGSTYEEAAKTGHELVKLLVETYQTEGRALPEPATLEAALTSGNDRNS
jgi:predicted RNase H-like HicB family nuclease